MGAAAPCALRPAIKWVPNLSRDAVDGEGAESRENQRFTAAIFDKHLHFSSVLRAGYVAELRRSNSRDANLRLLEMDARLVRSDLKLSMTDSELRDWCAAKARACREICARDNPALARVRVGDLLYPYGIEFPGDEDLFISGLERTQCALWWRRTVRRIQARTCEQIARDLRLVNDRKQQYVSDFTVQARRQQKARNRSMLEDFIATNQDGDSYTLAELSDLSTSNPEIRRCELMVRCAGFEAVAKARGLVAEFYTVTCPSKFHPIKKGGVPNEKYNGSSVRDAQRYLCGVWARARASLARAGVRVFGFRVAEPHHDGCPHWHFLFFMPRDSVAACRAIVRGHALAVDGGEVGAAVHRFKAESIDPNKGSATGYIAKYISKGINGAGLDNGLFGEDEVHGAERVSAWASTHGLRQFQQIGGPCVTVWRELRRLASEDAPEDLEPFREAADASDWAAFVELMGGPFCGRQQALSIAWWQEFDEETGECLDAVQGRYGDFLKGRVIGLLQAGEVVVTRFYRWSVERITTLQKLARSLPASGVFDFSGAQAPPWSSVNNCTG